MTLISRTYNLFLGFRSVIDSELVGSTVLLVKREGLGYDRNNDYPAVPGSREFQHYSPNGEIIFLNEGSMSAATDLTERVLVIFKYG